MANTGFGPLIELKRHLLPEALRSKTTWDDQLTLIGKAVVARFERFTNRTFARATADTYTFQGGVTGVVLPRYPIEDVTDLDLKINGATSWDDYNDSIANYSADSGIVEFEIVMGRADDLVRVTFDGGFWWETAETEDTAQPAGSTAIPDDLKDAWMVQTQAEVEARNILGTVGASIGTNSRNTPNDLTNHQLLPLVEKVLTPHRRFA